MAEHIEAQALDRIEVGTCEKCGTLVQVIAGPDGPTYRPIKLTPEDADAKRLDYLEAVWRMEAPPLDLVKDWRGTWRRTLDAARGDANGQ